VAHPQIAAFARLAEGSAKASRKIEGQKSSLGRTMHSIAYDEIHDEIVVPQQLAQAILVFRGGATGEEPPIRVIQGPLTQLAAPDQLAIDPVHNEIFIPEREHVLVFSREANGNVAPIRVLKGPDTLLGADMAAVDPVRNLLVVSGRPPGPNGEPAGFSIFNRTDQGNVKPKWRIAGSNVGSGRVYVYPPKGELISAHGRAVGVWSIDDRGNIPPRWLVGGPGGELRSIRGIALDPKHKSVIVSDKQLHAVFTYHFPQIY